MPHTHTAIELNYRVVWSFYASDNALKGFLHALIRDKKRNSQDAKGGPATAVDTEQNVKLKQQQQQQNL